MLCEEESGSTAGLVEGSWPSGETRQFKVLGHTGVPVIAFVEPDRDGDGYGDETQDNCPDDVAYQAFCPPPSLGANARARKHSIIVWARVSADASVRVFGQVGWQIQPQGLGEAPHGSPRRLIVGLDGGAREVTAGTPARFAVLLPRAVRRRLRNLSPERFLMAKLHVRGRSLAGPSNRRLLAVKLFGQDRPQSQR